MATSHSGNGDSGSTRFAMMAISRGTSTTFISIRSSMGSWPAYAIGRIRRFTCMCVRVYCQQTEPAATSTELLGDAIHEATISGVLLLSHRIKIAGSFS